MFSEQELSNVNLYLLEIHKCDDLNALCETSLRLLPGVFYHDKAYFCCYDSKSVSTPCKTVSFNMSEQELSGYNKYSDFDCTAWFLHQSAACVYRDSDIVSDSAFEAAVIYSEWLAPMGMRFCCGNVIAAEGTRYGDITVFRSAEHGDFTKRELFLFEILTDHLCMWFKRNYPNGLTKQADSGEIKPRTNAGLLSAREQQVAELICEGMTTEQISAALVISPRTTRKHISNIFRKLSISSRIQLVKKLGD